MVRKTVAPCRERSPSMCSQRLARACGSRPVVGSSRNTSVGSWISPITTSRRRFCPPDMFFGIRFHSPSSWSCSKSSCPGVRRRARHPVEHPVVDDLVPGVGAGEGRRRPGRRSRCCAVPAPTRVDHVVAGDRGRAGGRPQQRGQHPQRGGLAGAVGAEEADHLALLDVEVDAVDGAHLRRRSCRVPCGTSARVLVR